MAVTNFIPTIWSARLLTLLQKTHVAGGICNRDYEGDTVNGNSVKITTIGRPTVTPYTGADLEPEDIDDSGQTLLLDQANAFNFFLRDVERVQSVNGGAVLSQATLEAGYELADKMDLYVLSLMHAGATSFGNEQTITAAKVYELLVDLSVKLDEANVPDAGRWAVVTPAIHGALLKDSRFVAAGDAAGAATRANGRVGEAAGLTIYKSNNLPASASGTSSTNKAILAGSTFATTVAEQINSIEAYRTEKNFADGVKGLHVYGAKVTRPTGIVTADVVVTAS